MINENQDSEVPEIDAELDTEDEAQDEHDAAFDEDDEVDTDEESAPDPIVSDDDEDDDAPDPEPEEDEPEDEEPEDVPEDEEPEDEDEPEPEPAKPKPVVKEEPEPAKEDPPEDEVPATQHLTPEQYAEHLSAMPDTVTMPDGTTIDLKAFQADVPETAAIAAAMAHSIVQRELANILPVVQEVGQQQAEIFFRTELVQNLSAEHKISIDDIPKIAGGEEFQNWLKEQPKTVYRLAETADPESNAYVLDLFFDQRDTDTPELKDDAPTPKKPSEEKRDRKKKIHRSAVKSKKGNQSQRSVQRDDQDYDSAFDEEASS